MPKERWEGGAEGRDDTCSPFGCAIRVTQNTFSLVLVNVVGFFPSAGKVSIHAILEVPMVIQVFAIYNVSVCVRIAPNMHVRELGPVGHLRPQCHGL